MRSTRKGVLSQLAAPVAVAIVLVLAGCAGNTAAATDVVESSGATQRQASAYPDGQIVSDRECAAAKPSEWFGDPGLAGGSAPEPTDWPLPVAVPADFDPVAAYVCGGSEIEDPEGLWNALTINKYAGDLAAVIAAMSVPDEVVGNGDIFCVAMAVVPLPVWLVDASGTAIYAHWPMDECNFPTTAVEDALAAAGVAESISLRVNLSVPRAAMDAGCPVRVSAPHSEELSQRLGDEVKGVESEPEHLSDGSDLTWCQYTMNIVDAAESGTGTSLDGSGNFESAGTLTGDDAAGLITALTTPSTLAPCDDIASEEFLIVTNTGSPANFGGYATVWLDGCESSTPGGLPVSALPTSLTALFS